LPSCLAFIFHWFYILRQNYWHFHILFVLQSIANFTSHFSNPSQPRPTHPFLPLVACVLRVCCKKHCLGGGGWRAFCWWRGNFLLYKRKGVLSNQKCEVSQDILSWIVAWVQYVIYRTSIELIYRQKSKSDYLFILKLLIFLSKPFFMPQSTIFPQSYFFKVSLKAKFLSW